MNEDRTSATGRITARVAIVLGLALGVAVGAPWLLHDAPPSPEAVVVTKLCCAKTATTPAPRPAPPIAPAR